MAFDIRPPSTNSANKSTSRSSSSSRAQSSSIDSFAAQLAARPSKPAPAPKQTSTSKPTSAAKQSTPAKQPSSSPRPAQAKPSQAQSDDSPHTHPADRSKTDPARTNGTSQDSGSQDAASDNPYAEGDSPTDNPAKGNTKDVGKGRGISRGTTDKAARTAQSDAEASQLETLAKDPTDEAGTTGLNLLQLLAQASHEDNSDPASSITDDPKAATDEDKTAATDTDPNALLSAMLSQLFAGAIAHQPVTTPNGTAASGTSDSGTAAAIAAGALDTARSSNGATGDQALLSLLEQKLAGDASGKTDTQSSDATAATSSSDNKSTADGTAARPDAVAQSLAQMGIASHFARNTHTVALQSNVSTPAWKEELGSQLTYMSHHGLESGSLRVSPEHLGQVEVQISVQNGDASVWFGANHPDTRAALEQALPRLREMFAQQGLTLTDSGVSREPPRNQTRSRAPQSIAAVSAAAGPDTSTAVATRINLGLVDTYA